MRGHHGCRVDLGQPRHRVKRYSLASRIGGVCVRAITCCVLFAGSLVVAAGDADTVPRPELTEAERAWLQSHPVVRLGVDAGYGPYSFVDASGRFCGVAADFLRIISDQVGVRFETVPGLTWPQIIAGAQQRAVDVIATAVKTPEREDFLAFTDIYIPTPLVIMTRAGERDIAEPAELRGRRVALVEGYSSTAQVLAETPDIQPVLVADPLAGLRALSVGQVDAYVGVLGVNTYLTVRHGIANLQVAGGYDMQNNGQRFGVRSDWPELATILDKALAAIPESRKNAIFQHWIPVLRAQPRGRDIWLTPDEHRWLARHPKLRVGISPHDEPLAFLRAGKQYGGIAADYLAQLHRLTGVELEFVPLVEREAQLRQLREGAIDVIASIGQTTTDVSVSRPYLRSHLGVFTRKQTPFIGSAADLKGQRVAVVASSSSAAMVAALPEVVAVPVNSLRAALEQVDLGNADAALVEVTAGVYLLDRLKLRGLRLTSSLAEPDATYAFAVRADYPELLSIIDKVIQTSSAEENAATLRRWMSGQDDTVLSREVVMWWALGIGLAVAILFLGVFGWNRRLGREIARRQRAERELLDYQSELELRVTERTERLNHQANHDALTGLLNRSGFDRQLDLALQSARGEGLHHALLYLDMDQFKIVNDTCGHRAGDELLRQLAVLMRAPLRERDTLARLGGDEFGILLEGCSQEVAASIGNRVRELVEAHRFSWEERVFRVGVSIGVVPVDSNSSGVEALLSAADMACFVAKDAGRNRVHLAREGDDALRRRTREMEWLPRLQQALQDDALVLYYQRIVALGDADDGVHRCEILLRLPGDDEQLILPGAFVPASERYGLDTALDRWVIRQVFASLGRLSTGRRFLCAINLSGHSLSDSGLVDYVRSQQALFDVDPGSICFEITETVAISNLQDASRLICALRTLGYRFALDDFGSGLSSFPYLKSLQVDYLKIEGGFVTEMTRDAIDFTMVESIVRIGQVMEMSTVAECVEDQETLEALRALGVDFVQGYHLHRPAPLSELIADT